jgi:hypothetical protein
MILMLEIIINKIFSNLKADKWNRFQNRIQFKNFNYKNKQILILSKNVKKPEIKQITSMNLHQTIIKITARLIAVKIAQQVELLSILK